MKTLMLTLAASAVMATTAAAEYNKYGNWIVQPGVIWIQSESSSYEMNGVVIKDEGLTSYCWEGNCYEYDAANGSGVVHFKDGEFVKIIPFDHNGNALIGNTTNGDVY